MLIYSLFITFYAAGRLATYQFAILYLSMLGILTLQLLEGMGGETATTLLGKITGALQYAYLLFLVALEVVPEGRVLSLVNLVVFAALAVAIVLNTGECAVRVAARLRGADAR